MIQYSSYDFLCISPRSIVWQYCLPKSRIFPDVRVKKLTVLTQDRLSNALNWWELLVQSIRIKFCHSESMAHGPWKKNHCSYISPEAHKPLNIGPSTVKPPKQGMHTLIFQPSVVQKLHSLNLTASVPLKIGHPKRKFIFHPSIFRCKLLSGRIVSMRAWKGWHQPGQFIIKKSGKKTSKAPGLISEIHNHLGNTYLEFTKSNWIELSWNTILGTNISHLGKKKIIFKSALGWDMLVPWRVTPPKKLKKNIFHPLRSHGFGVRSWGQPSTFQVDAPERSPLPTTKNRPLKKYLS